MNNSRLVPIDGNKLKKEIQSKNLEMKVVSKALGYTANFISTACGRGSINPVAVRSLEILYGIKYDDYKPEVNQISSKSSPAKMVEELKVTIDSKTFETLYNVVYDAVHQAVIDAFEDK